MRTHTPLRALIELYGLVPLACQAVEKMLGLDDSFALEAALGELLTRRRAPYVLQDELTASTQRSLRMTMTVSV